MADPRFYYFLLWGEKLMEFGLCQSNYAQKLDTMSKSFCVILVAVSAWAVWSWVYSLFIVVSDNTRPAMSKSLSLDFGFFYDLNQIKPFDSALSRLHILVDPLGNRNLLQQAQKVMVCDWWTSIRFVCFCVLRFVAFELQSSVACFWKAQ